MFRLAMLLYNLILPLGFIVFLPGLIYKLIARPGWKKTFMERFGCFGGRKNELSGEGGIWFHAVSVGETMVALSVIRELLKRDPDCRIILSTTTTTGQQLARAKAPEQVKVIFSPIDFYWTVRKFFRLLKVEELVICETEIWPNLIMVGRKSGVRVALVNARMSDHSSRGYYKWRCFFAPLLASFDVIAAQSSQDAERFSKVSPEAKVRVCGNIKFDQHIPDDLAPVDYSVYFGPGDYKIIIGASTHPGEEALLIRSYQSLRRVYPDVRLVIAPRHAERGGEIAGLLRDAGVSFSQRSTASESSVPVDVVLADTTGELVRLMKGADIVIMGKSLAGQDEGHNLIEPALLGKPIVTGSVLRNFRFVLQVLADADAVKTVDSDDKLTEILGELLSSPEACSALGDRARNAMAAHGGAVSRLLDAIKLRSPLSMLF